MDTTTPRKKVLSTPKDWDEWFLAARDYATDLKVWYLVDPDAEHVITHASKPRRLNHVARNQKMSERFDLRP